MIITDYVKNEKLFSFSKQILSSFNSSKTHGKMINVYFKKYEKKSYLVR
jgi:hypothetical protein